MSNRTRTASNAVKKGTAAGTVAGTVIDIAAAAAGFPLPPGTAAALGGLLVGAFSYFAKGGRKGEAH